MSDGEVVASDMTILEDLLQRGFTPVLHGDCVRDRARGFGILSGDGIVEVSYPVHPVDYRQQTMEYCYSIATKSRVQLANQGPNAQ